jgi:hypothetical protein
MRSRVPQSCEIVRSSDTDSSKIFSSATSTTPHSIAPIRMGYARFQAIADPDLGAESPVSSYSVPLKSTASMGQAIPFARRARRKSSGLIWILHQRAKGREKIASIVLGSFLRMSWPRQLPAHARCLHLPQGKLGVMCRFLVNGTGKRLQT